jgi:glycosyltransferase involved in cell wall biosynthesis
MNPEARFYVTVLRLMDKACLSGDRVSQEYRDVACYSRLPIDVRQNWPLMLTCYHGWRNEVTHQRLESARREGCAFYLGFVPSEDLPLLFADARLFFTFPSLYEGFGLSVL